MTNAKRNVVRLHRETIRVLAPGQLAGVRGGVLGEGPQEGQPKTNAWSASVGDVDGDLACGAYGS